MEKDIHIQAPWIRRAGKSPALMRHVSLRSEILPRSFAFGEMIMQREEHLCRFVPLDIPPAGNKTYKGKTATEAPKRFKALHPERVKINTKIGEKIKVTTKEIKKSLS